MKKILLYFSLFVLMLGGVAFYDEYQFQKLPLKQAVINTDMGQIQASMTTKNGTLLFGLIKRIESLSFEPSILSSNQILNDFSSLPVEYIQIKNPKGETNEANVSMPIPFELKGIYELSFEVIEDNFVYEYAFLFKQDYQIDINFSDEGLVQGDIIKVRISNVLPTDTLKIKSHFKPSLIHFENYSSTFYLPIAYREAAQVYPLNIQVNEEIYRYELDVEAFAFKEIYFTVPSSTVTKTVGNQDAVIEYREVIYPTYESAQEELYISDPFILPLENARISSTFGEMRFVNEAKTPTRHAGIDYAMECGTPILAANRGYVEVAQFLTMIGNTIVIDHGLGLKTYYEHMQDIVVQAGEVVERGQIIGHVGTTGYSTGCHLHFQAMIKNQSFNPDFLLQLK